MVKYQPTNIKGTFLKQKFCDFFPIFFIKAYIVATHLNCINKLMQFKWVSTTYAFIKK